MTLTRHLGALFLLLTISLPAPDALAAGSGGVNAPGQLDKPYLILISIDGFGWDARGRAATPALDSLAGRGVVARSMRPAWPSLTFPNHYAIATGLYPAEHGIVGNNFPSENRDDWYSLRDRTAVENPAWYDGEPIWVTAEKAGMVAASYFFVGTEAPVQGIRPTYSYLFDAEVPPSTRVSQVLEWLALPVDRRPHMLTLYFEHVDDASHRYGPDAPETVAVIEEIDGHIGRLLDGIDSLPIRDDIYIIVVSDHGQARYVDPETGYVLSEHVDIRDAGVVEGGNYVMLYYDSPDAGHIADMVATINRTWEHGEAFARGDTPDHWRVNDDERYPDVFIQADIGQAVMTDAKRKQWLNGGAHGWPPESAPMGATFIAAGPRLPAGKSIGEIRVVDVYPLMLDILDLPRPAAYDVRPSELIGILEPAKDSASSLAGGQP
jgi:predicted AlkP superfamily pyrophosphatase or phosphodiesterase